MSSIEKRLVGLFAGESNSREHLIALAFLHQASSRRTRVRWRGASWPAMTGIPDADLGRLLDQEARACLQRWPHALDGFLDGVDFATCSAHSLRAAIRALESIERSMGDHERFSRLANLHQFTRSLSSQQWMGAFFTPESVAALLAQMHHPRPGQWVGDLTGCGGGAMLIQALDHVRCRHGDDLAATVTLLGIELDHRVAQIARASLILAGAHPDQFHIATGDALASVLVGRDRADGQLKPLAPQVLLGNPPFGGRVDRKVLEQPPVALVVPDRVLYRPLKVPSHQRHLIDPNVPRAIHRALANGDGRLFVDLPAAA